MDVDFVLLRNIASVIFIFSFFLYDGEYRLQPLKTIKNVAVKKRELIYYLLFALPSLCISSVIFKIWKSIISVILRLKRNSGFVKLLGGQNLVYIKDFNSRHELPTLVLMKFDGTSKEFCESMKLHIHNVLYHKLDENQTICAEVRSYKGFHYITRDKVIQLYKYVEEFVVRERSLETLTKRQLLGHIATKYNTPLNINSHPLWKIYIGKQTVKWNDNDDTLYYPLLFRFSHCLFDRESFMKLILGTFADIRDLNLLIPDVKENDYDTLELFGKPLLIAYNFIYNIFETICYMYTSIPMILVNHHLLKKKKNALRIRERNKSVYLYTLDMGPHFQQKVDVIKIRFPNATEFSILEAVVAACLTQYSRRNEMKKIPVDIVCMSVENAECSNLAKKSPESLKFEEITYESNIGFTLLNICTPSDQDIRVQDILERNHEQKNANIGRKEVEITRSLFNGNYFYYFNLLKNAISSDKSISALINNCPGPLLPIKMNRISVEHIISWSPHLLDTGMSFSVCSYRDTYLLTMSINRSLLDKVDTADGIIHNIQEFLNTLSIV